MLLRYSSRLSAINGVCSRCNYSMKWLILQGNTSKRASMKLANPNMSRRSLKSGSVKNLEVISS